MTGGAGYIGSHTVFQLLQSGHNVVVLDNFYSGHHWALDSRAAFYQGDIADQQLVEQILGSHQIEAVAHFAAYMVVPESVEKPFKYHRNNVVGSLNLIESCIRSGVNRFVFSSSAATYGIPDVSFINETTPQHPINPYGTTKLMTEWMLRDIATSAAAFNYVALRYFNVAGAHSNGNLGQATPAATHLIKVACQTACEQRDAMAIFGDDYATPDGTCIRDYIHVEDLADAHVDAISYLEKGGQSIALNCGYGVGYSVRQVIDCVKKVSSNDFAVEVRPRRAGDPPQLVADNSRILALFDWQPRFNDLEIICKNAFEWECRLNQT